jgi:hypothetical protein
VTRETQPERTRLSWRRTWLSLAAVGVAEAHLVANHRSDALGIVVAAAALVAAVGWVAMRGRDAVLAHPLRTGDGRTPALMAGCAVAVGILGAIVVVAT